jgi:type IV fimbrial biogenesis protein FimT
MVTSPAWVIQGRTRSPSRAVPRHAHGFTLIELLTALGVVAILAMLAAPSFDNLIRSQRIRGATNDLVSTLIFARSEAVKRNADVTVGRVGSSWAGGWTVTYDDGGTKTARVHSALSNLSVTATASSLIFGGGGRANTAAIFTVDSDPQKSAVDARCVEIGVEGLPRIWIERGANHDCSDD